MKIIHWILIGLLAAAWPSWEGGTTVPHGPYLGQKPPGSTPELFAPGIVSTGMEELNAVFSPDGKELVWSVQYGSMRWALVGMRQTASGAWTRPEVMSFSGVFSDVDACFSPDGARLWFASNRPVSGESEPKADFDIWYVDRLDSGWGKPVNPGSPVNSEAHEFFPCIVNSGAIYFQSRRSGGPGSADIFRCAFEKGGFSPAEPLPGPINNSGFQGDTYVAPDESFAILSTTPMGKRGWSDLFLCRKKPQGDWGPLVRLGKEINSPLSENTPFVTPDGRYLFFKSRKRLDPSPGGDALTLDEIRERTHSPGNGSGDIYWVSTRIFLTAATDHPSGGNGRMPQ